MGIFDRFKKQDCEICGKEVGMFGYKKLEDGEIRKKNDIPIHGLYDTANPTEIGKKFWEILPLKLQSGDIIMLNGIL